MQCCDLLADKPAAGGWVKRHDLRHGAWPGGSDQACLLGAEQSTVLLFVIVGMCVQKISSWVGLPSVTEGTGSFLIPAAQVFAPGVAVWVPSVVSVQKELGFPR